MRRPYSAARFIEICDQMRAARPGIGITTDVIVGFPGETEEDYAATRSVVERIGFENAYIFRYSQRKDTPAAALEAQLPESIKEERNQGPPGPRRSHRPGKKTSHSSASGSKALREGPSRNNAQRLAGRTGTNRVVIFDGDARRLAGQLLGHPDPRKPPDTPFMGMPN
ncbi:MAG: hypothetical protein R3F31_11640 [Verrucomicrobiales bacterium]